MITERSFYGHSKSDNFGPPRVKTEIDIPNRAQLDSQFPDSGVVQHYIIWNLLNRDRYSYKHTLLKFPII